MIPQHMQLGNKTKYPSEEAKEAKPRTKTPPTNHNNIQRYTYINEIRF
jgi:hypothetical protein